MGANKFIAGIILGAAAGAALTLFLQSDKGKEIISDIKDAADEAGTNLKSKLNNFDAEVKELLRKGKQYVEDLENKAREMGMEE